MLKDISVSAIVAGLMAVLVSYSGPLAIVFQAGDSAGISHQMMTSWIWAISMAAGVTSLALSAWLKVPVLTAWSAPGTVLLLTLFPELSLNEAVGAYITAALVLLLIGVTGWFDRVVHVIPRGVSAAMIGGILFDFGLGAFRPLADYPLVTVVMVLGFVAFKLLSGSWSLVLLALLGFGLSLATLGVDTSQLRWELASPQWITPQWNLHSTLSLALPLVIVSLTGQFLPGFAILKNAGYQVASRPILTSLSLVSIPVALFGGITSVLAAITASICTSPEAHPNPDKRYIAGIANGIFYLIGGLFAGSIVLFFTSFPTVMIAMIAGLALLGAISNSLQTALSDPDHRDAALVTFMTTASGVSLMGIGAAFWGIVLGGLVYLLSELLARRKQRR
ncbi:benzoate/H(+) symporter BenE family transporter [Oceanobacter mangrovi]|uniref:benzoate/H(+) symporter BenE family transporter n=1 Tax=Oceanobacter mangrovi TaxID=2862510 RepID=UPI001C8F0F4B|nr:benzoate/H(+) symporter BenE family transporter [Oceanobacter mangrovi]